MKRTLLISLALAAVLVGGEALAAKPNPAGFTASVDNPWFPLEPGTTYVYTGVRDGKPARDVVTVTRETIRVDGVACVVVKDRLYLSGRLRERTADWYTQDRKGNVWYFGEDTAELDRKGHVTSTEGSWKAGVNGATPGIYMPAHPKVGQSFRQEFYKGHAEDHFRIVGLFGAPGPRNALLTEEWTPLEPGVLGHKLYVRGVGLVVERTVKGGDELMELVSLRRGS